MRKDRSCKEKAASSVRGSHQADHVFLMAASGKDPDIGRWSMGHDM